MVEEEWYIEAGRLLDKARHLSREERVVFKYFIDNVSVGTLRAVRDLKRKGVENAEEIINRLIELGLIEKGEHSYSLSAPLRKLRAARGGILV